MAAPKRSHRGLVLGLLATVGGLGYLNWRLWDYVPDTSPITAPAAAPVSTPGLAADEASFTPAGRSVGEFPQTTSRPLFFANRRPPDRSPPKVAAAPVVQAPVAPPYPLDRFQLVGILRTGKDPVRALIRTTSDGYGTWVSVGEQVRGWHLRELTDDNAVIEANGQRGELRLYSAGAKPR